MQSVSSIDRQTVCTLIEAYQHGDDHAGNILYTVFIQSKFCYNGKPRLGKLMMRIFNASSVISNEDVESAYWLGWVMGMHNNKFIGDPLAWAHNRGKWYARNLYIKKLRDNILISCVDCGHNCNIMCSKRDKKITLCPSCGSTKVIHTRFTSSMDANPAMFNSLKYDNNLPSFDIEILHQIRDYLRKGSRALELLDMFISREIEIDSEWKRVVASKWGVSEFRVVIVWRTIKEAALNIRADALVDYHNQVNTKSVHFDEPIANKY